jgi:hypothetical protein
MKLPRITLAFLSWNRLHYLRAALESARRCIRYPDLEWIVSDNESIEPGLRSYIEGLPWVDRRLFRKQTHADAMNELVALATGDLILIWPEDVQFVVEGDWLQDVAEIVMSHPHIGSVGLDGVRASTLRSYFQPDRSARWRRRWADIRRYGTRARTQHSHVSSRGFELRTLGDAVPGICGSGIPTLTRTSVWRELGPWRAAARGHAKLVDSSLGAEDDMVSRFNAWGRPLQMAVPMLPVAADILTDPLGCKAKVRGRFRYGVYMPPPEGTFYYRIRPQSELADRGGDLPLTFTDVAQPIGFRLPLDAGGERLKFPINTSVVFDIEKGCAVRHPLAEL